MVNTCSGITADTECVTTFQQLKTKKKLKYILFKLSDDEKCIVVDKSSKNDDFEAFLEELNETECRYAVYDFQFQKEDGVRNKICFISWAPSGAKTRAKMLNASSTGALSNILPGIQVQIRATSYDEISWEAVLEKAQR